MRQIIIFLIFSVFAVTDAFARLPLEEIWSVRLDSATALGNAWLDEDGNTMVLVGDGWRALLISDGEIIWRSYYLAGPVTALARIPYEDGEQILVAVTGPLRDEDWDWEGDLGYGYLNRYEATQAGTCGYHNKGSKIRYDRVDHA